MKIFRTLWVGIFLLPAAAVGADLEELNWMAGDWRGDGDFQEVWLKPVNGFMNGVSRLFTDGQLIMHEHMFIAKEDNQIIYRLKKHLRDDSGTFKAHEPIIMRAVETNQRYVLFENADPNPEEPRLLAYQREGDRMTITVTDPPGAVTEQLDSGTSSKLTFELRLAEK